MNCKLTVAVRGASAMIWSMTRARSSGHAAAQEQGMRIEDGNGVGDEQAEGARRVVPEFDSIFDALFTRLLDTSRRWVFIFAQP